MSQTLALALAQNAVQTMLILAAPILGVSLVVGLIIGILQAVTQINEMTLTFVPKLIAIIAALILLGGWMLNVMLSYTSNLFTLILPSLNR